MNLCRAEHCSYPFVANEESIRACQAVFVRLTLHSSVDLSPFEFGLTTTLIVSPVPSSVQFFSFLD